MNTTAYCVVHMDTTKQPPQIIDAHIYSEGARSLSGAIGSKCFAFDVLNADGENYTDAVRRLTDMLISEPAFSWVLPLLAPRASICAVTAYNYQTGQRVKARYSDREGTVQAVVPAGPIVLFDGDTEPGVVHGFLHVEPLYTDLVKRIRDWRNRSGLAPYMTPEFRQELVRALAGTDAVFIRDVLRWRIAGTHDLECFLCNAGWWDEGGPEHEVHLEDCIAAPAGCRIVSKPAGFR